MKELTQITPIYNAKKYFIYIGMQNILDMILTLVGTINEYGVEINPLLSPILNNIYFFILIKGIIPTLLLLLVFIRLKHGKLDDIIKSIKYLKLCFNWYIIILSSHLIWILNCFFKIL